MALKDIDFSQGEGQDFLVELPGGTLHTPKDILIDASSQYAVLEAPLVSGGGGDIFIIND